MREQGHRRTEFEVIRRTEHGVRVASIDGQGQIGTFFQSRSQKIVTEIGTRFVKSGNAEVQGHRTAPETFELGKDEPHPVASFATVGQFPDDCRVDRLMGRHETAKAEGAGLPVRTGQHPYRLGM